MLLPPHTGCHPLGSHRLRIPDRVVFDKPVQALICGCAYHRIADDTCSASTLRRRRDGWVALGVMDDRWRPDQARARGVHGTMILTGNGSSLFVLRAVDEGPPASGEDAVALAVGDHVEPGAETTGVDYVARGPLIGGDICLLIPARPAMPAP